MTRLKAYGRWQPFADAAPVREHVGTLRAAGLGSRRIAELAGVSYGAVCYLLHGYPPRGNPPPARIRPETARRLRSVRPEGGQPFADAAPVREHVGTLRAAGLGSRRIAELADVSYQAVSYLLHGHPARGRPPPVRIRAETARRLRSVRPGGVDLLAETALTDGTGTRRRLQALVALGFTESVLGPELGLHPDSLSRMLRGDRPVLAATARAVRLLYDRWWDQQPPRATPVQLRVAAQARARAARREWPPPQAWDDPGGEHSIDDPAASPAPGWKRGRVRSSADLAADAADLQSIGYSRALAAERLGVSRDALDKAISRTRARKGCAG